MPQPNWDERYLSGETPWDTGEANEYLIQFIHAAGIEPGQALDIGCGTGTNSLWLAQAGFTVLGIDVSSIAIEKARAKAAAMDTTCRFERLDFLTTVVQGGPFRFVFDLGCLHLFDEPAERACFAERVASLLEPNGRWLSLVGSTEGPARDWGPPRRSAREIAETIEPALAIVELRAIQFHADLPAPPAAWMCVSRPRTIPAQPSTRRND